MPILVDYSQVALASILQFQNDLKTGSDEKVVSLIRHVVLSSLVSNKKKFGNKYGEMIICCDARNYWRKEVFANYKSGRKKNRDKQDLNWKLIFDTMSQIRDELQENFPYKILHVSRAEADDIIGVMAKYYADNELVQSGIMEDSKPVLILSSDGDNVQLQKYQHVTQWSPMQKKLVKPASSAHKSLIDKICMGDSGDFIPNIMSHDNVFINEERQKSFRKARLEDFYKLGINACANEDERRNYSRNELLVSYEKIPTDLQDAIVLQYKEQTPTGNRKSIYNYLVQHKCKLLLDEIENF